MGRARLLQEGPPPAQAPAEAATPGDSSAALLAFLEKKEEARAVPSFRAAWARGKYVTGARRRPRRYLRKAGRDWSRRLSNRPVTKVSDHALRPITGHGSDAARDPPRGSSDLVDELANEAAKLKKKGIKKGFVFVKLAKWLPQYLAGALRESEEETAPFSNELKQLAQVPPHPRGRRACTAARRCDCGRPLAQRQRPNALCLHLASGT